MEDLRDQLHTRIAAGAVPLDEARSILRDVATALEGAHGLGVVHRDIRPENILLSGRTAVETDFGIAKARSASKAPFRPRSPRRARRWARRHTRPPNR